MRQREFTLLMAGGIGLTPLVAMGHRLHALGKEFVFHYSVRSRDQCGFADELSGVPWSDRVFFHFSSEGKRADFAVLIPTHCPGFRLYACGSDRYMDSVFANGSREGLAGGGPVAGVFRGSRTA